MGHVGRDDRRHPAATIELGDPEPLTRAKAAKRLKAFLADKQATQGLPLSVLHHLQTLHHAISEPKAKRAKAAHEGDETKGAR